MFYTKKEDRFLRKNYLTIPTKRMSKMLGRSESSARQRMKLLGIVVPPEIILKFKTESRFSKGHTSFNKGKKQAEYMSRSAIAKTKKTRFKKGQIPHNTKFDGHERITKDGYIEIRVKQGKYVLKHRLVWEQENGKIPAGHCLWFLDGNAQNCSVDNLELITRAENMKRNTIHNYPAEIVQVTQLRGALNRQINKHLKNITS